jgi:cyanophycinase
MSNKSKGKSTQGTLIIIGGHEDREGEMKILREVAEQVGNGKLCIATVASNSARDELWRIYRKAFRSLGVKKITHLSIVHRDQAIDHRALRAVKGACAVFFTGGDQLKITSELGGTVVAREIEEVYARGGTIAGTSAGASVMSETMLVSGMGVKSYRRGTLRMAPGLGFVKNVVIDQHFAERGRIGRLVGAVAHNPKFLGIGIDEDTGIVASDNQTFRVIGNGGVYVVDAHEATGSNISDARRDEMISISNMRFHVLREGDHFDMLARKPISPSELAKRKRKSPRERMITTASVKRFVGKIPANAKKRPNGAHASP